MGREDYSQSSQLTTLSGRPVDRYTILPRSRNTLLNLTEARLKPNNRLHYGLYPMIQNEYSATYVELVQLDLYPPVMTLTGDATTSVYQFDTYIDHGITVDDGSFIIQPNLSNVNTSLSPGSTFDIVYSSVDGAGHSNSAIRAVTVTASPWSQQAKIQSHDIETGDYFGGSVSMSSDGNTAIVGANREDTGAHMTGAAYIFTRSGSTWSEQAKIQSSDKERTDFFGYSVSISDDGNTAIVGAYGEDTGFNAAGAAYIFTRSGSTWSEQAKIQALDRSPESFFGYSVSISGDGNTAIVGARYENSGGTRSGAAYVFTRSGSTWTQQAKIQSSDIEAEDRFGTSVDIYGDYAVVGAPNHNSSFGSAYIFTRSGSIWSQQAKIQSPNTEIAELLGYSVSISGDGNTVIVGANAAGPRRGMRHGAAYIYVRSGSTWSQQAKITALDRKRYDVFGISVSISNDGNVVAVGAHGVDDGSLYTVGAAYIFIRSGNFWIQRAKIDASDKVDGGEFGRSVSILSDGSVIAGAPAKNGGAAYFFTSNDITSSSISARYVDPNVFSGGVIDTIWLETSDIQSSDIETDDFFGISASISSDGKTAIVGAYREDTGGTDAGAAYIFTRSGSIWEQQAKIQSSDIETGDYFGRSVSISSDGNTVIVGAYGEDTGGTDAGAAYIFTRSELTWTQQAKIQSSDIESGDNFGGSVSISSDGNTVIVGANGEDTGGSNAGAAYIFTRSGSIWSQQAKIQALDKEADDSFGSYLFLLSEGSAVSISGDGNTAIVAAQLEDTGGQSVGAAYIFTRSGSTWTQQAKIQALDKQTSDNFGSSVSISSDGNTVIVGAVLQGVISDNGNTGAAYIFTRSGSIWEQQAKIQSSDIEAGDNFGYSVYISNDGNIVVVGATGKNTGGTDAGAAYIFTRSGSTWTQQSKIQPHDVRTYDNFGSCVSMSGDGKCIIAGVPYENTGGTHTGAAYFFTTNAIDSRIVGSDTSSGDYFGHSTAIYGDYVVVGAPQDDDNGANSGSVYIFRRTGANTWDTGTKIVAPDGASNDLFGTGVDIYGDYVVVGAPSSSGGGAAYIFRRTGTNTWDTGTKIVKSNTIKFGQDVAIHGDYVVVGAPPNYNNSSSGSAYIFRRTGTNAWDTGTLITPPAGDVYKEFGQCVAIYGDYVVVGAPRVDLYANGGCVYIFRRTGTNTWDTGTRIESPYNDYFGESVAIYGDYFGQSVAIYEDYVIIGASYTSVEPYTLTDDLTDDGRWVGAAYIYHRTGMNTWDSHTRILPQNSSPIIGQFGKSVSIYGNYAIVGEWWHKYRGTNSGAAYIFTRTGTNTWNTGTRIMSSEASASSRLGYGWSVDINGGYAVVGDYRNEKNGYNSGSAFTFDMNLIV